MEDSYSNRELDAKFDNLTTFIREKHDDVMIAIGTVRTKTTYTNGRVRWQEKMIYLAIGGLIVLSAILLPSLGWIFTQVVHNSNQISSLIARLNNK